MAFDLRSLDNALHDGNRKLATFYLLENARDQLSLHLSVLENQCMFHVKVILACMFHVKVILAKNVQAITDKKWPLYTKFTNCLDQDQVP